MKNCISRRSFLKAAGILGAAGALAACGGSSSTSTAASSTASSAAASAASTGASIKLWTYPIGGWGNDDTVQNLISSFNAKYPDIKVTVEYLDYTNGDDQVNTAIEGGSAPDLVMEGPERLVANWGAKGVMAPLNDLWTDDAKKDIYASVESACHNEKGDYYEYPLCMTAHCMAVNMTKVKEVGADKYIDTDKHTWSTEGFLNTVDALYKGGYENVAAIYCSGQGGDQAPAPSSTICTAAPLPMQPTPSTLPTPPRISSDPDPARHQGINLTLPSQAATRSPCSATAPCRCILLEHCTAGQQRQQRRRSDQRWRRDLPHGLPHRKRRPEAVRRHLGLRHL